jgi:hypothetical protein
MANLDDIKIGIGSVIMNLLALEFAMRAVLHEIESSEHDQDLSNLGSLRKGSVAPLTPLTDYASLGEIIKRFNKLVKGKLPNSTIDSSVIELRDTLAHGRTFMLNPEGPFRILKFDRPVFESSKVPVASSDEISREWLKAQCNRVLGEIAKVVNAGRELGLCCFPTE